MFGRDKSSRFQSSLPSPSPGHYDSRGTGDGGYKTDLNSSFAGSGRFSTDIRENGSGSFTQPPQRIPSRSGSRAADWTTNRIKDLETELRISKAKIMELQQHIRESNLDESSKEDLSAELHEMKNKLLVQKANIAQAERKALQEETDRKKLESDQANLEMRIRKSEESRKISEAKASEAKYKVTELEKQVTKMEDEYDEMEEEYRKEIQALKKRLATAESSRSKTNRDQDEANNQLTELRKLTESQKEQITTLEVELGASKAAAETLTAESIAESLVIKTELAAAAEKDQEKDALLEQLREEIAELKQGLERTLDEKEALEAELVSMRETNDANTQTIGEMKDTLEQNEIRLKQNDEVVAELETKIETMQTQSNADAISLKQAEESVNSLKEDLMTKTSDLETVESKVDDIAQVLGTEAIKEGSIGQKLDQISLVVTKNNDQVIELQNTKDSDAKEVENLTNKLATVIREKKAKVSELERLKKEEKSLRQTLAEQEKRITDLTKKMNETRSKTDKESQSKQSMQAELKTLRAQLDEKKTRVTELEKRCDSLTKESTENASANERTVTELQKAVETTQAELARSATMVTELETRIDVSEKLVREKNDEVSVLQHTLTELQTERDVLKSALDHVQSSLSETKDISQSEVLEAEIAELKRKLNEAIKDKTETQAVLTEQQDDLEAKLNALQEEHQSAKETIESRTRELEQIEAQKAQLEEALKAVQKTSEQSSTDSTKLTSLQKSLTEKETRVRELEVQINEAVKKSDVAKSETQKLQTKLTKMESDLRQKHGLVQELQQQVKSLKQEKSDLVREREHITNSTRSKLSEKDRKIQKYEAQIRSLQSDPKSVKDSRPDRGVDKSNTQNDVLRDELDALRKRLAFYEGTNLDVTDQDETTQLRASLSAAQQKFEESQKLVMEYKRQLKQNGTMRLEMERLTEENSYLSNKTAKFEADATAQLTASTGTAFVGHHNQKQRIQYHLKMKTELEELKKQYTVLSRHKFKLEQAIRYLAARADLMSGHPVTDVTGTAIRAPSAAVAPASTKESVVLSTPTAKEHMKWTSRGRGTTKSMNAYKSREYMERGIEKVQVQNVMESEALKRDANDELCDRANIIEADCSLFPLAEMDSVENRILSTISSVVNSRKRRASTVEQ